jgi:hypothetical protein
MASDSKLSGENAPFWRGELLLRRPSRTFCLTRTLRSPHPADGFSIVVRRAGGLAQGPRGECHRSEIA